MDRLHLVGQSNKVGDSMSEQFTELLQLKKSRKKPKTGDIFVMQVKSDLYYYGKVIKTEIKSLNPLLQEWNLVYIYNYSTRDIQDCGQINKQDLLLPPLVTNHKGWYDGYFLTIGNEEVSEEELNFDYGYWDDIRKVYRNEEGTILEKQPKFVARFSLVSYGGIGRGIHRILNNEEHKL